MTMTVWPLPCRACGVDIKQQTEWNRDATSFRQKCHACGHQGDWEPYAPPKVGYSLYQIEKAAPVRLAALGRARSALVSARSLSLAYVPLRQRIDAIIADLDDCLRGLRP
jgi:hypothetical protein